MIDDFNTLMTKHLEFRTCISIEKLLKKNLPGFPRNISWVVVGFLSTFQKNKNITNIDQANCASCRFYLKRKFCKYVLVIFFKITIWSS